MDTSGDRFDGSTGPFDFVLWGATGFTGSIAAEYIVRNYSKSGLRFAFGGRSDKKLTRLRADLTSIDPSAADVPLLVGDSFDRAFLTDLASKTKVVCSTVGPYSKYGGDLVAACVQQGTDYCDLTAEVPFIRKMIDAHDSDAKSTGSRVVHCCGFDSVPSDLGTLLLQEIAGERHGAPCVSVHVYLGEYSGGLSGGTIASALNLAESVELDPSIKELLRDAYALNPDGMRHGPDTAGQRSVLYDRELEQWTAPFVMEPSNSRVVRRTNALLDWRYGKDFRYAESMATGSGTAGWFKAAGIAGMLGVFGTAIRFEASRNLLQSLILPSPGEGPGVEKRAKGFFRFILVGKTANGKTVRVRVESDGDPGYTETAKMLVESAVSLAQDAVHVPGGSHTPATAMGMRLVERLRLRGMRFLVE